MKNKQNNFICKITSVSVLLCMLLGIFAPTVMATTEGAYVVSESTGGKTASNNSATEKKDNLVYVSIGDSMTNGYGLEGYDGESGIMNYGNGVYANQFAAWLAGYEGKINDNQVIFAGDKAVVDHRQLAMSGMRAEDLNWILNFDHTNAALALRAVDSKTNIDGVNQYHHWNSWENCGRDANGRFNGNCDSVHPKDLLRYRWYHDTENFGFTAGDYRTWDDLLKPYYRFADGAAEILNTYYDESNAAYGYFTSSYANAQGANGKTITQNAIDNKGNPNYPEENADDIGEMAGYVWLQVATEFYQKSVEEANVISLALGNTNFGTFMFQSMKEAIGAKGAGWADNRHNEFADRYKIEDVYYVANFDEEMQKTVEGLLGEIDALIEANFDADMLPEFAPGHEIDGFDALLDYIKYIVKFCVLSYVVNYIKVVERILELNPDAQIIQIALMNAYAAADDGSAEGITMGGLIDMLYTPLNAFIAAVPAYLQKEGAYSEAKFYYADCGTVETMTDVFGDDYYTDAEGNYIPYPGLDHSNVVGVNANSTSRQRFVFWVTGYCYRSSSHLGVGHCYCNHDGHKGNIRIDYGEFWKNVLIPVTDPGYKTSNTDYSKSALNLFGTFDLMFLMDGSNKDYQRLVDYLKLSPENRWEALNNDEDVILEGSLTKNNQTVNYRYTMKDLAFSCEMYLAFEDAIIRAGKSSIAVANLGQYGSFDLSACESAFANFYQKNNITSMTDKVDFSSYEDVRALFGSLSDELVKDPASNIMLAMANRMEIGTGIGGHTSAGGHTDMFEKIVEVYESEYTSDEEFMNVLESFLKDTYPNLYESMSNLQGASAMDDLDMVVTMLKLAQRNGNSALEGVDIDALENRIRVALRSYSEGKTPAEKDAAIAAVKVGMKRLVKLAEKATYNKYEANADSFYVSLGDSNVNGFGLDDYVDGVQNGITQVIENSAPVLLAKKLFGDNWKNQFGQYAQGALRAEDLLYILGDDSIVLDDYYYAEIEGNLLYKNDIAATRADYLAALKKTDIISLAIGGGNVTTFVGEQVDRVLAGEKLVEMDWAKIGFESAAMTELNELLDIAVPLVDALGLADKYLPEGVELDKAGTAEFARVLLGSILYGYASYNYYYPQVLAKLREINPDAQLLILGMFNPVDEWNLTVELEGEETFFDIGAIVGNLMDSANLQNLAYALQNANTTFVDLGDNVTFLDEDIASGAVEPTFDVYYESILKGNGKEVHASEAGHEYMFVQMFAALQENSGSANLGALVAVEELYDYLAAQGFADSDLVIETIVDACERVSAADADADVTLDIIDSVYDNFIKDNKKLTDADRINAVKKVYSIFKNSGSLDEYEAELKLVEELSACIYSYVGDEKAFDLVEYIYNEVLFAEKLDKQAILDYVYNNVKDLNDSDRLALVCDVYFILKAEGELSIEADMLDLVEELAVVLDKYIDDTEALALVDEIYAKVFADRKLDDDERLELVKCVYNVALKNNDITAEEKIDLIVAVYEIIEDDYLGAHTELFDTVANVYTELTELGALDDNEAFAIIDFVYGRIIDLEISAQEIYEIATYIYKILLFATSEADSSLESDLDDLGDYTVALPTDKKLEILDVVFGELENASFAEQASALTLVIELYTELKNDEDISEETLVKVFDTAFEALEDRIVNGEEVDIEELATEVVAELITTDNISLAEKVAIINTAADTVERSGLGSTAALPDGLDLTDAAETAAKITGILASLDEYISEDEANEIFGELAGFVMSGGGIYSGAVLVIDICDRVAADLSEQEKLDFVRDLCGVIKEEYALSDSEITIFAVVLAVELRCYEGIDLTHVIAEASVPLAKTVGKYLVKGVGELALSVKEYAPEIAEALLSNLVAGSSELVDFLEDYGYIVFPILGALAVYSVENIVAFAIENPDVTADALEYLAKRVRG